MAVEASQQASPPDAIHLITGGAGFIGSHLVERLLSAGHRVVVLDNLSTGDVANLDLGHRMLTFMEGDICDIACCRKAMAGVTFVYHLAAMSKVLPSLEGPDMAAFCHQVNVDGTMNLLRAAHESGTVRKVVYAGSSTYYGNTSVPSTEAQLPDLLTPYAVSKYQGELLVQMFWRMYSMPTCTLRFFMVYGPRQPLSGAYATVNGVFLSQARAGQSLTVEGDGQQSRDFIHVIDVAEALTLAMKGGSATYGESINVGSGTSNSVLEVARVVSEEVSSCSGQRQVGLQCKPPRAFDMTSTLASIRKAKSLLGWQATIAFNDGMRSWVREEMSSSKSGAG